MPFSRNPVTGNIESYTENGFFMGYVSTMGDFISQEFAEDGGPGSGNFNHEGRPGLVGGSGSGGGSGTVDDITPPQIASKFSGSDENRKAAAERANPENLSDQLRFFARYMDGVMYGQGDTHDAAYSYSCQGDVRMNNLLRGGKPRDYDQQKKWKHNTEKTKKEIDDLTRLCDKNELKQPAVVFRGIETYDGMAKFLGLGDKSTEEMRALEGDPDFAQSLIGQTFSDPAFTSTTVDYKFLKGTRFIGPCELEIYCPEGTKGVYFGDQTRFTDEHEFLLQRGTQFVITDAEVVDDAPGYSPKVTHIKLKAEVVAQVPKDIPEKHEEVYQEPRQEVMYYVGTKKNMRDSQMQKLYSDTDPEVLKELNSIRKKRERDFKDTEKIWELVSIQRNLGKLNDTEAAELESYAMNVDRDVAIDSYRRDAGSLEYKIDLIKKGEYANGDEFEQEVRMKFPHADESVIPMLVVYQNDLQEQKLQLERDKKMYGDDFLSTRRIEYIEELERSMEYIARQKRKAG